MATLSGILRMQACVWQAVVFIGSRLIAAPLPPAMAKELMLKVVWS